MSIPTKLYSYSINSEYFTGEFATRQEAIQEAVKLGHTHFWTAENVEYEWSDFVSGESIIEDIKLRMEEVMIDSNYEANVEELENLDVIFAIEEAMNNVLGEELSKPTGWGVQEVTEHKI
jgi:hypothetical protein